MEVWVASETTAPLTLEGLADEGGRLPLGGRSIMEGLAQVLNAMAVNDNGMEAEGLKTSTVNVRVVLQSSRLALTKPAGEVGKKDVTPESLSCI